MTRRGRNANDKSSENQNKTVPSTALIKTVYTRGYKQGQTDTFWSIVNEVFDYVGSNTPAAGTLCKAFVHMSEDQGFPVPGACSAKSSSKSSALNFTNVDLQTFFVPQSSGPKNRNQNRS